jgi:sigma-E factor negative regulatory protein RseC
MIEETGRVVGTEEGYAWVETVRRSACTDCSVRSGCGTSVLARLMGRRGTGRVRAVNAIQAMVGERVVVGISESGLVRGSLAVYAVPLCSLLAGALFGDMMGARLSPGNAELFSILFGAGGLAGGLAWLRHFTVAVHNDRRYQPVILRREQHRSRGNGIRLSVQEMGS